jgi:deoxycytidine triphosphate deaminase
MILSDVDIRKQLASGRVVIDPFDDAAVQPSSVDLRVDRWFRVFANSRYPYIDVKQPMEDLTELVEASDEQPLILHPGEFILGSTLERVSLPDDIVARVEGKALSIHTEVPTPEGWRTMGDLAVGDHVFDEKGWPTPIVATSEVMVGRPCREVIFSDHTGVIADLDHRWVSLDKNGRRYGRRRPRVVTTRAIESSLRYGHEWNHHVDPTEPVRYPPKELPIDPYVLGVWLGDGTSTKPELTCADPEILDEIELAGYSVAARHHRGQYLYLIGGTGRTRDPVSGRFAPNASLSSQLRTLGLLGRKHVPAMYMQSSIGQRLALLQGLMDSDGYVDVYGRCEFTSTTECLADAVCELAASFGLRPVKRKKRATLYGVDCGPAYLVKFTPSPSDPPVFRLEPKLERLRCPRRWHERSRAIKDVRRVASVPVRCIQVATSSGMFLVTRAFIPTHNSSLGRLGLLIHSTAGFVDAGWDGHLTLELSNVANLPITIYPGMKIGQLCLFQMSSPAERPYGSKDMASKYQGQTGPTPSRYYKNFESD